MKKYRSIIGITVLVPTIAILLWLGGCFKATHWEATPRPDIVWPPAPEIPRIRFVNAVSKPEDLQIRPGVLRRFFDYMAGKTTISMMAPYGVETDSAGRLYVVDTFLRTVHVFDVSRNAYYAVSSDKSDLASPIDIAVDDTKGSIYVSDSRRGVVKIFENLGKKFVGDIGQGILKRPTGIAINVQTSELLVVDTRSSSIFRFDLDDHHLKGKFGGNGTGEGRLHYPTNIYVAGDGAIFVTDSLNFRIQKFSPVGEFVGEFGQAGDNPGYFARPRGVAVDSAGHIYVVDGLFDNIQIFDQEFKLLMVFGNSGRGYGEFWLPAGIFIDSNDTVYVSDSYNKRVQIFQYLKEDVPVK